MTRLSLDPIATVHNGVDAATDTAWGAVDSRLVLAAPYHGMLAGLDQFSHILVVFWMHESAAATPQWQTATALAPQRHPRDNPDLPLLGLLAQRARSRPNPIGVTVCERIAVAHDALTVRGLDAIDGTRVLDIKPHVPAFDTRPAARVPPWMDQIMADYFARPA